MVVTALIVATSLVLMLLRPRGIAEVWWVSGGAIVLVLLGRVTPTSALAAAAKGGDVYFFLAGMMLLSALASAHGVFDWLSSMAVRRARGSCRRLFATVYGVGTVVTVLMSNDATAVVLTPAILAAVRKAKVPPLPYLFACALIANAASFVLPISNPANLVVFHGAMPSLGQWLAAFALPSVLSIATTYAVLRVVFRRELDGALEAATEAPSLSRHGRLVLGSLGLVSVILLGASVLDRDLGLLTFVAAAVVVLVVSLAARKSPAPLAAEISWSTLVLVAGLFILVQAVENVGALDATHRGLGWVRSLPRSAGAFVASFVVGVANNLVNNLPLGLIAGATLRSAPSSPSLTHATLIGVDLGPNLAVTGSLATILWLLALRKEKLDVSFWAFLKVGVIAMPIALFAATLGSLASDTLWGDASRARTSCVVRDAPGPLHETQAGVSCVAVRTAAAFCLTRKTFVPRQNGEQAHPAALSSTARAGTVPAGMRWVTAGDIPPSTYSQAGGLWMGRVEAAKQFSFRLPEGLVERVEHCTEEMRAAGLELTRADVVRLLLRHALDATHCKVELLLGGGSKKPRSRRSR